MYFTETRAKQDNINNKSKHKSPEVLEPKSHNTSEIIEYLSKSVLSKAIIDKSAGNISILSFDSGVGLTESCSPFDSFLQIIEGKAEIVIDHKSILLRAGCGIIIPANLRHFIKPNGRFKMLLTIIKSE